MAIVSAFPDKIDRLRLFIIILSMTLVSLLGYYSQKKSDK